MFKNLSITKKINILMILIGFIMIVSSYFILNYYKIQIEKKVYETAKTDLKYNVNYKLSIKKQIGLTNAINISNNKSIQKALKLNKRELAFETIKKVSKDFKDLTKFKNVRIHIYTKDNKSFIRSWNLEKYGDDLSSSRKSVVKVNKTKCIVNTLGVDKSGLSLRSVVRITDQMGKHLGSLEFIQGLNSAAKAFNKKDKGFLLLMKEKYLKNKNISENKKIQKYIISQKFINKKFLKDIKSFDIEELVKKNQFKTKNYLYTYKSIKDLNNEEIGIIIVGTPIEKINHSIKTAENMINIMLIIILTLIITVIIFTMIMVNKLVKKPLEQLNVSIKNLTKTKDVSEKIEIISNDEIGKVTENFNEYLTSIEEGLKKDNIFIEEVKEITIRVSNGWYSQYITKEADNKILNEFKINFNKMISATKENIKNMNLTLDKFSNYNYTEKLIMPNIEKNGVFEKLITNINGLQESITNMLVNNQTTGFTLEKNAHVLLDNVGDLSKSSNEGAASLEETAAAVEEITSNISNNTNNVIEMSKFTRELKKYSNEGQKLANQTTESMKEIDIEVNSINEAITVIDQISFQTNILSLNAAVEAATAGEAGKGFAVVAQEVRSLAGRSAEAAQSIKDLVEKATTKTKEGTEISIQMIEGYENLNENVIKTSELINDIEVASKEQQKGIEQINDAINILDQQTQRNANVASETKNISESTLNISEEIVKDVSTKEFIGKK